jgi:hypothetical protein
LEAFVDYRVMWYFILCHSKNLVTTDILVQWLFYHILKLVESIAEVLMKKRPCVDATEFIATRTPHACSNVIGYPEFGPFVSVQEMFGHPVGQLFVKGKRLSGGRCSRFQAWEVPWFRQTVLDLVVGPILVWFSFFQVWHWYWQRQYLMPGCDDFIPGIAWHSDLEWC